VAIVAAYCAAAGDTSDSLIRATERILTTFQILDDLQDVEEDLKENNLTVFAKIVKDSVKSFQQVTGQEAYPIIMRDPKVRAEIARACVAVGETLLFLDHARDAVLISYLSHLARQLSELQLAIEGYQSNPTIQDPLLLGRI